MLSLNLHINIDLRKFGRTMTCSQLTRADSEACIIGARSHKTLWSHLHFHSRKSLHCHNNMNFLSHVMQHLRQNSGKYPSILILSTRCLCVWQF